MKLGKLLGKKLVRIEPSSICCQQFANLLLCEFANNSLRYAGRLRKPWTLRIIFQMLLCHEQSDERSYELCLLTEQQQQQQQRQALYIYIIICLFICLAI